MRVRVCDFSVSVRADERVVFEAGPLVLRVHATFRQGGGNGCVVGWWLVQL